MNATTTDTEREIWQQPQTWETTVEQVLAADGLDVFLESAGTEDPSCLLRLSGAGTSDYICEAVVPALSKTWGLHATSTPTTDLLTEPSFFLGPTREFWLSFSRSGDSPEAVFAIQQALQLRPETHHLIITCNRDAEILKRFQADRRLFSIVLPDVVNDRSLAMTSSFTNLVIAGYALALRREPKLIRAIASQLSLTAAQLLPRIWNESRTLIHSGVERVCFLGSGALRAAAREAALKTTELTAGELLSFSESFLGLRHGPLAAVNDRTLIVALCSGESPRREYELDLLRELRAKHLGSTIFAIGPSLPRNENLYDLVVDTPTEFPDVFRVPIDVIAGQCLGFHANARFGLDPDRPSKSGAINRVVPPIPLHPIA